MAAGRQTDLVQERSRARVMCEVLFVTVHCNRLPGVIDLHGSSSNNPRMASNRHRLFLSLFGNARIQMLKYVLLREALYLITD